MLTRVFGRKKYGKTQFCMSKIAECVNEKKNCIVIVPEQFTFSTEKRIVDEIGNRANLYVEVLSFTRLAHRAFLKFGNIPGSFLDNVGKVLCMTKVLSAFQNQLTEYSKNAKDISFAASAVNMVHEFAAYGITSTEIEKAIPSLCETNPLLCAKLNDISLLTAAYKAELKANYGTDGECLDMLYNCLENNEMFKDCTVILDSFYGYTPQELKIIKRIISGATEVYITFCTIKGDKDPIFKRPFDAYTCIGRIAEQCGCGINDIELDCPQINNDISIIERSFTTDNFVYPINNNNNKHSDSVQIVCCKNPLEEAKAVCALINNLVVEGQVRYKEIAICARNINQFDGIIDVMLEKSCIPFTYSKRDDLFTKPLISYILTAIDLISSWKQQSFLQLIKTGLVKITPEQCGNIENYIRAWNINGKKALCGEWFMNPSGYKDSFSDRDMEILEDVVKTRDVVVDAVTKFQEDFTSDSNCKEMATAVYNLMLDSNYCDNLENDDDIRFWNLTTKALDEIVKIYGDEKIGSKQFSDIFKTVINEYGLLDIPEKADSVLVGSVDLVRSESIKYMFVLGCNNEYFPMAQNENEIFSDREKRLLAENGIFVTSPSNDRFYDEYFLAYNVFCDPYEKLYLTYSKVELDGKALRKSILLNNICKLFSESIEREFPFSAPFENIMSKNTLSDYMYDYGDHNFVAAAKELLSKEQEYKKLFDSDKVILNQSGTLLSETTKRKFGKVIQSSPSRFETYAKCRFMYFNNYILKLNKEVKAELDSINTGLISHKMLELFVSELAKSKVEGNLLTKHQAHELMANLLETNFKSITHVKNSDADIISKRFKYLYGRLKSILFSLCDHFVDELSQSDFLPVGFEVNIGIGESSLKTKPIDIKDLNGQKLAELHIVGQVDRIDVFEKNGKSYIRIVDYKTGHKKFNKDDVAYGYNMQMLLYLYCVIMSETKRFGENPVPAGILYIPVRRPDGVEVALGESTESIVTEKLKKAFNGDGLLISDIDILYAMEKGLNELFIPVKSTKDGLSKNSKIESLENLGKLMNKATEVCSRLAYLMYSGNIQTNPYRVKDSSCANCDFNAICRIDRKNDNIRYEMEEVLK